MSIFDTTIQQEQIKIPDYNGDRLRAAELKQNQQINQLNIQKFQEERIKSQRENEKVVAANKLSQLSLSSDPQLASQALSQLAAVDPDRAKKNVEYLYERSAAASSYATTALLAPREIKANVYKHVIKEARNDPRIDQQALAEFPDEYTPDLDAKLYAVAQGHRKLEDGLKAHQEAATLANTEAKTKTEGFQQANLASEIAKRKIDMENAKIGKGKDAPQGYRYTADGNLEAIPGGPAGKLSAESAGKVALIKQGEKDIDRFSNMISNGKGGYDRIKIAAMNTYGSPGARNEKSTLFNAVNARLRLESGSAVPEAEVERAMATFAPNASDSNKTIKSKLERMSEFFGSAKEEIGQGRGSQPIGSSKNNAGGDPLGLFN